METAQLRTELQQRIEKERLVAKITQQIHQNLDLKEILQTTVNEVRQFLHTEWVLIFRLDSAGSGTVMIESVAPEWTPLFSTSFYDPCLNEHYFKSFRQGLVTIKSDIHDGSIDPCHVGLLDGLQVKASLVVPIIQNSQWIGTSTNVEAQKELEYERDRLLELERNAREAAERSNRIKDEFLAILSHELRSPLTPILGWTKLLKTPRFDETKTAQALATIERNAKLQTQLIDDLLDVSKIMGGKLNMNFSPVNLAVVIESALDAVRTYIDDKSILLHSVVPNIGQVFGDHHRLQQILTNLFSNAIKFTPTGGRIEIRLEQVNRQAKIMVTDTGEGIHPDFLPYIFESFRQQDTSVIRKHGGLGLGLALVLELVEAHKGSIRAESPGVGQGATFTVKLPLLDMQPEVNHEQGFSTREPDLTGIRILTIDDEPDTGELLTVLFTQYGAEVMSVTSSAEALLAFEWFKPDILVSDLGMPNVDGYTLLQQIRSLPAEKGGSIPAIALTAYAREIDQKRALAVGFQKYITKPMELNQLSNAVLVLLRGIEPIRKREVP